MVFEGWVVDHLSAWLGHFFDLQRDQLRISLWRGEMELQALNWAYEPACRPALGIVCLGRSSRAP